MTDSSQQIKRRPKLYMSFGVLRGQYQPSEDVSSTGVLVTEDGVQFPAIVQPKLEQQIQQQPELINTQQVFGVWPCTSAESLKLFMKLKGVRKEDSQQRGYPTAEVDKFSICGVVVSQDQEAGKLVIQIKRNGKIPPGKELDPAWQPFNLEILGELPAQAVGQFWELTCARQGEQIVITEANLFVESLPAVKKQQACAIKAPAKSSTVAPAPGDQEIFEVTPSVVNTDISLTQGKMEVVVKLNQFPDDVRTVDKEWKEFVVDTGNALVTITVKPKVFATLEQAKLDYSDWVADISGQMGEVTATGFRLESPAIKVFERKAKSPPEQTVLKDSQEPATELQPSPPEGTQSQQATAQSLVEPQKTPPAGTNPMQRPKEHLQQQLPPKVPLKRGQHQQRDNGQAVGKQPTTTATQNSHQSQPRFTVTVDGRVFSGFDSVTLNKRMVCIDGKFVGQAKMIVVLGEPLSIQADGEVRQGRNQAVLTSR